MSEQNDEYDGPWIERRIEWKCPDRKRHNVVLFGSWNRFFGGDELEYQGKKTFACNVKLPLGTYVYRFLIDAENWEIQNGAPKTSRNGIVYNQITVTEDSDEEEEDAQNTKLMIGVDGILTIANIDNKRKHKKQEHKKRKHKKKSSKKTEQTDEDKEKEWAKYVFVQQLRLQQQHNDEINRVKTLWKQEREVRVEMHKKVLRQMRTLKDETNKLREAAKTGKYESLIKHYQVQIKDLELVVSKSESLLKSMKTQNELNDKMLKYGAEKNANEMNDKMLKYEPEKLRGLKHLLNMLNDEINVFQKNYNQQQLQQIMRENASKLTDTNSSLNIDISSTSILVQDITTCCTLFAKQIEGSKKIINDLVTPNISQYETWNISQIMSWILSLSDGKYKQYENVLLNGFIESKITGKHLPVVTRYDLSAPPFNIGSFEIKLELEKHFQSLHNINNVNVAEVKVNENIQKNNVIAVVNWSKNDITEWINNIGLKDQWKETVLNAIKNGQYDGRDMMQVQSGKDIANLFAIQNPMLCNRLWRELKKII